jgi:DNA-binding MarR family transcriptional regulator
MSSRRKLVNQIEENLLDLILSANRARIYEQLLAGANLNIDKALYPVLSATAALGPARVSQVAAILALNPTTTSRHLQTLEHKGLVSRTSSPTDGRAAVVELTDYGQAAVRQLRTTRKKLFEDKLQGFDSDELERFASCLERLTAAFLQKE